MHHHPSNPVKRSRSGKARCPDSDKKAQLTRTVFYTEVKPVEEPVKVASN